MCVGVCACRCVCAGVCVQHTASIKAANNPSSEHCCPHVAVIHADDTVFSALPYLPFIIPLSPTPSLSLSLSLRRYELFELYRLHTQISLTLFHSFPFKSIVVIIIFAKYLPTYRNCTSFNE